MYTFKFPVVNEDGTDALLTVGIKIIGRSIPQTWKDPGEEPEIDEVVIMDDDGTDVKDISEALLGEILEEADRHYYAALNHRDE